MVSVIAMAVACMSAVGLVARVVLAFMAMARTSVSPLVVLLPRGPVVVVAVALHGRTRLCFLVRVW